MVVSFVLSATMYTAWWLGHILPWPQIVIAAGHFVFPATTIVLQTHQQRLLTHQQPTVQDLKHPVLTATATRIFQRTVEVQEAGVVRNVTVTM